MSLQAKINTARQDVFDVVQIRDPSLPGLDISCEDSYHPSAHSIEKVGIQTIRGAIIFENRHPVSADVCEQSLLLLLGARLRYVYIPGLVVFEYGGCRLFSDSGIFQLLIHFEFKVLLLTGIFIILHI